MQKCIKSFLAIGMLILAVCLVYLHRAEFIELYQRLDPIFLIYVFALQVPLIGLGGYSFQNLMRPLGYPIRFKDWLGLSYIANLLNQIFPYRPGLGFRYWYLNKIYDIKMLDFSFVTLLYFALLCLTSLCLISIGSLYIDLPEGIFFEFEHSHLIILIGIMLLFLIGLGFYAVKKSPLFLEIIKKGRHRFSILMQHPWALIRCLAGFMIIQALIATSFFIIFMALNHPLPLFHCLLVVGLTNLGFLFPVTPSNLGLLEVGLGMLTQAFYADFSLGFSAILLYRAAQLFVGCFLGSLFSLVLLGRFLPRPAQTPSAINKQVD